jgi:hypothetical protein
LSSIWCGGVQGMHVGVGSLARQACVHARLVQALVAAPAAAVDAGSRAAACTPAMLNRGVTARHLDSTHVALKTNHCQSEAPV